MADLALHTTQKLKLEMCTVIVFFTIVDISYFVERCVCVEGIYYYHHQNKFKSFYDTVFSTFAISSSCGEHSTVDCFQYFVFWNGCH